MKNYYLWALLLIRITVGSTFLAHGSQKVFGLFGGPGLRNFAAWLTTLQVPHWLSYLAALSELIGGCLILLGIATELGALLIIPIMGGAIFLVHWNKGYFLQDGGFEYPLNLLLFAIAIIIGGPGKYALWDPFTWLRK